MNSTASGPSSMKPGYLSESARHKFALMAGLLGFVFFVIQAVIPIMLYMAMTSALRGFQGGRQDWPHVWNAVFWEGSLWYIEESVPRRMIPKEEATLQRLDPGGKTAPETVTSVFMENPYLLAGCDRLWIISPEDVRYFKEGRRTSVNVGSRLGDISLPFLLEGDPAVFEQRPAGLALTVFRGSRWVRTKFFDTEATEEDSTIVSRVRVVPCNGHFHLFMAMGETLYHREGLPDTLDMEKESWEPVVGSGSPWLADCLDGKPTVFIIKLETYRDSLALLQKSERGWSPHGDFSLGSWRADIGVVPTGRASDIFILSSWQGEGIGLGEARDGRLQERSAFFPSESGLKAGQILRLTLLGVVGFVASPIVLAFMLSGMMTQWRVGRYEAGTAVAQLAPLWRRAFAEVIDALILGGPMLAGYFQMVGPLLHPSTRRIPSAPIPALILILAGVVWAIAGFVVFSLLEGKLGATPGKWATGIRVLGTDLKPCGFVRGLVRNLLKVVDGFFNFMVGMLVTALSENWQRVGDMAAQTIVVRSGTVLSSLEHPGGRECEPLE